MKAALPRCQAAMQKSCIDRFDFMDCRAAVSFCDEQLSTAMEATGRNVYDITKPCEGELCYKENHMIKAYLDRPEEPTLMLIWTNGLSTRKTMSLTC